MFVIASDRPWNQGLAARLQDRTGCAFSMVTSTSNLSAAHLRGLGTETVFFPHWSHLIPSEIHEAFECVIFHMTDLPYGRGGSPLQNLIVRGHSETIISAIRCEATLDSGPVYLKRPLSLHGSAEEIFLRSDRVIEDMIVDIVEMRPVPVPQSGEVVSFARRKPADGDWSDCADLEEVHDRIRMLDARGYPPAFVDVGEFRLEFTRASRRVDSVVADVRIRRRSDIQ